MRAIDLLRGVAEAKLARVKSRWRGLAPVQQGRGLVRRGGVAELGQLCFPFWGAISDRVGRRPVMLGCLSASCVWLLLFGLAPSLTFAVVCRFAHGLCGGNVVVAKAMMADITDRSNETRAFVRVRVCVDGAC